MSDDLDVEGPGGPKIGPCVSLSQCLPRRFEMPGRSMRVSRVLPLERIGKSVQQLQHHATGPDLCAQRNYLGVRIDHFCIASGND